MRKIQFKTILLLVLFMLLAPITGSASGTKQYVFDDAGILTQDEIAAIEEVAHKYSIKRETDFIILTTNDAEGKTTKRYMQDMYDEKAFGYDKPHGNTVMITIDMDNREVYLAGFYKGKKYLDNDRIELINDKIYYDVKNGNYDNAIHSFLDTANKYFGIRAGVNPENILFKWWFQMILSIGIAGITVGIMAYNSGGKVTTNSRTYEDAAHSKVLGRRDRYMRKTVTKRKKPSNNSNGRGSGGVGGGGVTRGGHSHSGGGRKF